MNYLEKLVRDLDKRIIRGKERIQRSADHRQKVRRRSLVPATVLTIIIISHLKERLGPRKR